MKVLVTGGCGFLGSHVCEYYIEAGAEVIAFDNITKHELLRTGYSVESSRTHNYDVLKNMGAVVKEGDIRDKNELLEASKDCDYIVHTAAQPAMTISIEDPSMDFSTNVQGTFNVLETGRKYDIPVANCSTIHVYGNKINETLKEGNIRYVRDPPAIDENHSTLEGISTPLHASKRCAELYVKTYIETYGLEAANFRLTGIYGSRQFGGEDHGWVANFTIRAIIGMPITIFGTGKQVRDILYATDVAGVFDAFYKKRTPGTYNVGGGERNTISLLECIKIIEEVTNKETVTQFKPDRLGDLRYFVCDIRKVENKLGWQPKVLPREGISLLSEWINENSNLFKKK